MKMKLLVELWRFQPFRTAVRKEAVRFFAGIAIGLAIAASIRYAIGWIPTRDGLYSVATGVVAIVAMWFISVVRTIRAVLREHSLLDASKA